MAKARKNRSRKDSSGAAEKVKQCLAAKKQGLLAYQRADRLLAEIAHKVKPGGRIRLTKEGRMARLIDRFAGKDLVWTPTAARRWELEITEP